MSEFQFLKSRMSGFRNFQPWNFKTTNKTCFSDSHDFVSQTGPMHLWSDENLENAREEDKLMKKDVWIPDRYGIVAWVFLHSYMW